MSEALRLTGSFLLACVAAGLLTPVAIRLAVRTGFLDLPAGYKGHARATPYLGGLAVVGAIAASVLVFGVATSGYAPLLIWGLVLFVVGTIDDKRNLAPLPRLVIEVVGAAALWNYGLGLTVFGNDILDFMLTILWVVGLVNAFNLMDNMDGAATTVAGVSALGTAALAIVTGNIALAVIVLAVAGACTGFLPFNLAAPPRIFLGDGGSMPLGFVVAGALMPLTHDLSLGWVSLLALVPIVGLPIFDTTLVVISRRRGGRAVLSGGRDHLTHRLRVVLGSPRLVALALATTQVGLCIAGVLLTQAAVAWVVIVGMTYVGAGATLIYTLESRVRVTAIQSANGPIGVVAGSPPATQLAAEELAA